MDTGTVIIASIITIVGIIPFVLIGRSNKKREKRYLQEITSLAEQNNYRITQYNIGSNFVIGIDANANLVFFCRTKKDIEITQIVSLADIVKSRVINTTRIEYYNESKHSITDKLELAFDQKDRQKAAILFEFYNIYDEGSSLNGELQLIDYWCRMINDKIYLMGKGK
jgi:hypothetical protein